MIVLNDEVTGRDFDFWCGGHTIYGAVVVIVNMTLVKLFNAYSVIDVGLILLSVSSFWITVWLLSRFPLSHELYHIWDELVSSASAWFGLFICGCWVFTVTQMASYIAKLVRFQSCVATISKYNLVVPEENLLNDPKLSSSSTPGPNISS